MSSYSRHGKRLPWRTSIDARTMLPALRSISVMMVSQLFSMEDLDAAHRRNLAKVTNLQNRNSMRQQALFIPLADHRRLVEHYQLRFLVERVFVGRHDFAVFIFTDGSIDKAVKSPGTGAAFLTKTRCCFSGRCDEDCPVHRAAKLSDDLRNGSLTSSGKTGESIDLAAVRSITPTTIPVNDGINSVDLLAIGSESESLFDLIDGEVRC
ncbi:hypothetical protein WP1_166 [Pseudomonas phage WP1]